MKMLITDLDGTLLNNDNSISEANLKTLITLGISGIPRVAATGRSVHSAEKVMVPGFPIDYLIFSTGAGIYDWKKKKVIHRRCIDNDLVAELTAFFTKHDITFMLHHEIPDNHRFYYYNGKVQTEDYKQRLEIYKHYALPYKAGLNFQASATQFISIFAGLDDYLEVRDMIEPDPRISCIKATSPLNGQSIWLEVFARGVNKSSAARHLASLLEVEKEETLVVGNDWNDSDLLEWGGESYVVANAPDELKSKYTVVASNQENGFTEAVERWLQSILW